MPQDLIGPHWLYSANDGKWTCIYGDIDGLVQERHNSSAFSVAYRYRKSISIIELFVSIYIVLLATIF